MRYNQLPDPDVAIPQGDVTDLRNAIIREWFDHRRLMMVGSGDTYTEAQQCVANWDSLLDHYPMGLKRNEVSVDQAHDIARFAGGVIC